MSSKITQTIWPIEPHTEAKHAILKKYLDAWLPIMANSGHSINYVDGFAGPGEYTGGEEGSPLIAIRAIIDRPVALRSHFSLTFIEAGRDRCEFLSQKIGGLRLPANIRTECCCDKFDSVMTVELDRLERERKVLAPAFVFIDPFGVTGVPLSLISRIMKNPRCEVLITFMYEELNRFIKTESLWTAATGLFGNEDWRAVLSVTGARQRESILHGIYQTQLRAAAGIRYVLSFKMKNRSNTTDYFLFFGTNHILGLKKMKEAMWNVDESGSYLFSDNTYNPAQPVLFQREPDFAYLKRLLLERFRRSTITVADLEEFVLTETPFRETHYRRVLVPMEKAGEISAHCPTHKRRKGSFTNDCLIEFH